MKNLNHYIAMYQKQLQIGDILVAYNELVKFMMKQIISLIKKLDSVYSFTGILHGYMDYTYFYFSNDFLKHKKLKLGLVLNHLDMKFEIWLVGNSKQVQKHYWELLKHSTWNSNLEVMPTYSIIEISIIDKPDFDDLTLLSKNIETQLIKQSSEIIDVFKHLPNILGI